MVNATCYICGTEFVANEEKMTAWAESGRDFDPTDWECDFCRTFDPYEIMPNGSTALATGAAGHACYGCKSANTEICGECAFNEASGYDTYTKAYLHCDDNSIIEADVAWPLVASCIRCKQTVDTDCGACDCDNDPMRVYDEPDRTCACGSPACDGTCDTCTEVYRIQRAWEHSSLSEELDFFECRSFFVPDVDRGECTDYVHASPDNEEDIPF